MIKYFVSITLLKFSVPLLAITNFDSLFVNLSINLMQYKVKHQACLFKLNADPEQFQISCGISSIFFTMAYWYNRTV